MHWFIIAALLVIWFIVIIYYKGISIMPRLPLLGIDWIGMLLWSATAMSILFICVYGEHYDWWQSDHICFATAFGLAALGLNLYRATFLRHPCISLQIFKMPIVWKCVAIILVMDLLLAPSHFWSYCCYDTVASALFASSSLPTASYTTSARKKSSLACACGE
ncbi:MAG: hypothetical protein IJN02_01725 [Bacteroidales bacterium]|nr:hypothetical protein [Bacteroidales bacterium]